MKNPMNREAVAVFLGFTNALHDALHAGLLSNEQIFALTLVANQDIKDLLQGKQVEIREHDGETLSLESGGAGKIHDMLTSFTFVSEPARTAEGTEIVPTHEAPKGKLH